MWHSHHGNGDLGAQRSCQGRRQQTADPEARNGGYAAGDEGDHEEKADGVRPNEWHQQDASRGGLIYPPIQDIQRLIAGG